MAAGRPWGPEIHRDQGQIPGLFLGSQRRQPGTRIAKTILEKIMETKKLGIANVKMMVVGLASFGSVASSVLADGKIGLADFAQIMKLTTALGSVAKLDVKQVIPELSDLDAEEKAELLAVFDENFNIVEDDVEKKIEAGLAATAKALEAIQFIISLVK
jgi:hypothetical protein